MMYAVRGGLLLLLSSEWAATQPRVVPPLAKLGGDGVPSLLTTADVSSDVRLEVREGAPAMDCPDAARIRDALFAQHVKVPPGKLRVLVDFQRRSTVLRASIVASGTREGSRELELETNDCQALLQPLVVFLSLLLDTDAESAATPVPTDPSNRAAIHAPPKGPVAPTRSAVPSSGSAVPSSGSVARAEPNRRDTERPRRVRSAKAQSLAGAKSSSAAATLPRVPDQKDPTTLGVFESKQPEANPSSVRALGFGLDLGPLLIVGLVPRTAYGLELQGFARYQFLSLRVAAAGCAAETITQGDGRVRAQTYYGRLGLCGQWPTRGAFSVAMCPGSWLGRFAVKGQGLATDRAASPWFVAFGGFFDAAWTVYDGLGVYLRGGGFAPWTRHYFNVDGVAASVFHSQSFGAWIGLGASWTFQ